MDLIDLQLSSMIEEALHECLIIESVAKKEGIAWLCDSAAQAIETISGYLDSSKTGVLPRPSQGAGLGFSRGLGEWADDYKVLMDLAYRIDDFYSNECNSHRRNT